MQSTLSQRELRQCLGKFVAVTIRRFPKIRGTLLGFPIIRIIYYSIFGSILGSPYFGKLPQGRTLKVMDGHASASGTKYIARIGASAERDALMDLYP